MGSSSFCETVVMAKGSSTGEVDGLLDGLLGVTRVVEHALAVVAARHELTPQQVGLLRMLGEPVSMRELAEDRSCDPSNVTGLVDRAERLGLVARTPNPRDRRVRMLELTEDGRRMRARVTRELASEVRSALGITDESQGDEVARLLRSLGGPARRC